LPLGSLEAISYIGDLGFQWSDFKALSERTKAAGYFMKWLSSIFGPGGVYNDSQVPTTFHPKAYRAIVAAPCDCKDKGPTGNGWASRLERDLALFRRCLLSFSLQINDEQLAISI